MRYRIRGTASQAGKWVLRSSWSSGVFSQIQSILALNAFSQCVHVSSTVLSLYDEFRNLLTAFRSQRVSYALCGGMALAVHGLPRATIDIDLLVTPRSLPKAKRLLSELGYQFELSPMSLAQEKITVHRMTKVDALSADVLMVDLLPVTPALRPAWESRQQVETEHGMLWVVSAQGLIEMKSLRASTQDCADIERLRELQNES